MSNEIKLDAMGLPIINDKRSYEERVGGMKTHSKSVPTVVITNQFPRQKTADEARLALNATERALRAQNKRLILDHMGTIINNLLDLALTSPNDMVRVRASEALVAQGMGRPLAHFIDQDGAVAIPQFTIVYGNTEVIQQLEIQAQIEQIDEVMTEPETKEDTDE